MTNERNRPDTDATGDERVSRAYADLATERAPAHLDAAVLRKASQAAERPYKRSVLWTRPVAWAAVVAICLAITLQVTQVPAPEDIPDVLLKESDDPATGPARATQAPQEAASPVPETFEMQDADMLQRAEDMARQRAGENREAEYAARGVSSFAPASAAAGVDEDGCSEQARENPQDWLVCIALLEHAGRNEAAAAEREQLAAAFPDFEVPATSQ